MNDVSMATEGDDVSMVTEKKKRVKNTNNRDREYMAHRQLLAWMNI